MTIHLHGVPGSRSSRVQWFLEEVGATYDVHTLDFMKGEHKGAAHLALQPHGLVPAIDLGQGPMIESAAIVMALADQHADKGMAPALTSPDRARYYEAIVYAVSTLDETIIPMYFYKKLLPEGKRDPKVVEAKEPTWKTAAGFLEKRLGDRQFIVGDKFTAADVVVGYDLCLAMQIGLLEGHPKLKAYTERMIGRPAFRKVFPG